MVNEHPANFHPVPRGQAGQVECDTVVLNPPDLDNGPAAAVL
jgi:hypothetical protein